MQSYPFTLEIVRGIEELERTTRGLQVHRLAAWVRAQFPDPQLMGMEKQPSGARVVVRTTASRLQLAVHPTRIAYRGADRERGAVDVWVDGELLVRARLTGGDALEVDLLTGESAMMGGAAHVTEVTGLPTTSKVVEFWLPHNEAIELVDLRADAPLVPAEPAGGPAWIHYGSSISQGSNATAPSEIWPALAARDMGAELRNLGFGGSAFVDPFVARTIRDTPADLISVKLGINVVNLDAMRERVFVPAVHGFLDTIRDGHPDTPLYVVSPIYCPIHENTPGPGAVDPESLGTDQVRFMATGREGDTALGRLTLTVIRDALEGVVASRSDDANLHYLDGRSLYRSPDFEKLPLPDGLHPDTAAHRLIGARFAEQVQGEVTHRASAAPSQR